MRPRLAAFARTQHGLVTRQQAREADYTERELHTLTGTGGSWATVRRGVYIERHAWDHLDEAQRMCLRDQAAHLTMQTNHVLSHDSAARALGMPLVAVRTPLVHVTRPLLQGGRTEHGIKHHISRLEPSSIVVASGLPVTGVARTAIDLARAHGYLTGLAATDWARSTGLSRAELMAEVESGRCFPGNTTARAVFADADAGAQSPAESIARALLLELGIGRPRTQFAIALEGRVAVVDLLVGRHVFEVDGRIKYRRRDHGGVADQDVEQVVWDEKLRQRALESEGLGVSRIVWDDMFGSSRERTLVRLAREYAVTVQRYGVTTPPRLLEFAAAYRRAHPLRRVRPAA